jgi:hypothetical protein
MAAKIYSIKDKATGEIQRLVKADSQSQVKRHLAASFEIETIGAVEVVELMSGSKKIVVEDASAVADDEAAPAAGSEGSSTETTGEAAAKVDGETHAAE